MKILGKIGSFFYGTLKFSLAFVAALLFFFIIRHYYIRHTLEKGRIDPDLLREKQRLHDEYKKEMKGTEKITESEIQSFDPIKMTNYELDKSTTGRGR